MVCIAVSLPMKLPRRGSSLRIKRSGNRSATVCDPVPTDILGRTEIESKEEAKKRGRSSPDRAEVLTMAFMRIVPREQTFVFGERVTISQF